MKDLVNLLARLTSRPVKALRFAEETRTDGEELSWRECP